MNLSHSNTERGLETDRVLLLGLLPPLQHFGKEDVEALFNGLEDEPGHQRAQVIHYIIHSWGHRASRAAVTYYSKLGRHATVSLHCLHPN